MDRCICDVCGTENEPHYEYCKNCGKKLLWQENKESVSQFVDTQSDTSNTPVFAYDSRPQENQDFKFSQSAIEIDGVKTEDLAAYIGPNNERIIKKFCEMELSGSKTNWCWSAALWALFGPIGAAVWFIYRKMYKLGIIILVLGVVILGVLTAVRGDGTSSFENILKGSANQSGLLEEIPEAEYENSSSKYSTLRADIAYVAQNTIDLATVILSGLFSMYAYKKHTIKKIKCHSLGNMVERYHQLALMSIGGTSSGMAVLLFLVAIFLSKTINEIISILL